MIFNRKNTKKLKTKLLSKYKNFDDYNNIISNTDKLICIFFIKTGCITCNEKIYIINKLLDTYQNEPILFYCINAFNKNKTYMNINLKFFNYYKVKNIPHFILLKNNKILNSVKNIDENIVNNNIKNNLKN